MPFDNRKFKHVFSEKQWTILIKTESAISPFMGGLLRGKKLKVMVHFLLAVLLGE